MVLCTIMGMVGIGANWRVRSQQYLFFNSRRITIYKCLQVLVALQDCSVRWREKREIPRCLHRMLDKKKKRKKETDLNEAESADYLLTKGQSPHENISAHHKLLSCCRSFKNKFILNGFVWTYILVARKLLSLGWLQVHRQKDCQSNMLFWQ